jgi:hypothetical protein
MIREKCTMAPAPAAQRVVEKDRVQHMARRGFSPKEMFDAENDLAPGIAREIASIAPVLRPSLRRPRCRCRS